MHETAIAVIDALIDALEAQRRVQELCAAVIDLEHDATLEPDDKTKKIADLRSKIADCETECDHLEVAYIEVDEQLEDVEMAALRCEHKGFTREQARFVAGIEEILDMFDGIDFVFEGFPIWGNGLRSEPEPQQGKPRGFRDGLIRDWR